MTILLTLAAMILLVALYVLIVIFLQNMLISAPPKHSYSIKIPETIIGYKSNYSQPRIEIIDSVHKIVFNSDPLFFIQLLEVLRVQQVHPKLQFDMVLDLKKKLELEDTVFFQYVQNKIGRNKYSKFLVGLKKKPGFLEVKTFQFQKIVSNAPVILQNSFYNILMLSPAFFYIFDFTKDIVFVNIIRNTLNQIVEEDGTMANSEAEQYLWFASILFLVSTHILTGLLCFNARHNVFRTEQMSKNSVVFFNMLLLITCPLLPMFYMLSLGNLKRKLQKNAESYNKNKITIQEYLLEKQEIDSRYKQVNIY